uniref:GDSL esterase/lipase n=1 Tax=Leersia perrieri TaxID=77586 RepID=A0A0D9UYA9_9ORYZ
MGEGEERKKLDLDVRYINPICFLLPCSSSSSRMKLLLLVLLLLLPAISCCFPSRRRYDSIFSFGDSYADTGNGATLGLPFVPPFLAYNGSFRQGANFAVAGATTLDARFFSDLPGVGKFVLNTTSSVQLRWFDSLKPSLCGPAREFGVNDYSFSVFGKTLPEVRAIVPDVVKTISTATERLIRMVGAKTVVVPGIPPLGCSPPNLAIFPSADPADYEPGTGCLKQFNEIAVYHNTLLQGAVEIVQKAHPDVQVVYADFFTPVIRIVESPGTFGFTSDILRCCCGGGGKYNFNMSAGCGMQGATVCGDPSTHLFWDGHMTEAAYRFIANDWLNSIKIFRDSFADTGNDVIVLAENSLRNPTTRPPYSMTFFSHPTGRFSDGRLILDFIVTNTMKLLLIVFVLLLPAICCCRRYDSIFSFGDSFADTGNDIVVLAANSLPNPTTRPPYSMTFFGHPTGRFSDGRLILDFIGTGSGTSSSDAGQEIDDGAGGNHVAGASDLEPTWICALMLPLVVPSIESLAILSGDAAEKLGLPFVPPFLAHNGSFRQGANFAVAGATALDASFFTAIPGAKPVLNISSSVQLGWFDSLKPSLCGPGAARGCKDSFRRSLFFMGEFGVNDYNLVVIFGKSLPEVRSFVPEVVKTISSATERLIKKDGANTVVVPGIPPLGCMPSNLAMFPSTDPAGYEPDTGCLKKFNEIALYHNTLLQGALKNVRKNHPNVRVVYADFFTPVIRVVKSPTTFGFTSDILRCCCGGGGKYNFNMSAGCGMQGATLRGFLLRHRQHRTHLRPGETFFVHPNGRLSDGRLVIDFIAEARGLPLLPPSFAPNRSFEQGANFATAGATALDRAFFVANNFTVPSPFNISIGDQLGWFDDMIKHSLLAAGGCKGYFSSSLFVVGELGLNDYVAVLLAGRDVNVSRSLTPQVVRTISTATQKLIYGGARTVLVSGIPPMGCASANLVTFGSSSEADYEPDTGCLKNLNLLSMEHNRQLRQALIRLGGENPGVKIIDGDFYSPIAELAATPRRFGIDGKDGALRACCGSGGERYNINMSAMCGVDGATACDDPWDGVHLTEAAYHHVADGWLRGPIHA